jgi:hypothetical protein
MTVSRGIVELFMAQQHLNDADILMLFQQMGGKGMAQ